MLSLIWLDKFPRDYQTILQREQKQHSPLHVVDGVTVEKWECGDQLITVSR